MRTLFTRSRNSSDGIFVNKENREIIKRRMWHLAVLRMFPWKLCQYHALSSGVTGSSAVGLLSMRFVDIFNIHISKMQRLALFWLMAHFSIVAWKGYIRRVLVIITMMLCSLKKLTILLYSFSCSDLMLSKQYIVEPGWYLSSTNFFIVYFKARKFYIINKTRILSGAIKYKYVHSQMWLTTETLKTSYACFCLALYQMAPQWTYGISLTHWGRDKMAAIFQTTFSNAFSWVKMFKFRLRFHLSLFPRVQLTIFQHWFRWWLGTGQATSHYLKQWWLVFWRIYASPGLNELKWKWHHMNAWMSQITGNCFFNFFIRQTTKKTLIMIM